MDRRAFLVAAGATLAGCSSDTPTETSTTTTSQTSMTTTTNGPPLSVSASMASTVEIDSTATLTVAVTNNTSSEQTYTSEVSQRIQNGEWTTLEDVTVDVTVPGGETVTRQVQVPTYEFLTTGSYRLDNGEHVAITSFMKKTLDVGGTYNTPPGVDLTVTAVEFADEYTYRTDSGTETATPAEGEVWAVVHLSAINTRQEAAQMPGLDTKTIALRAPRSLFGQQVPDGVEVSGDQVVFAAQTPGQNGYQDGELPAGETREGVLITDVPNDLARAELSFVYENSFSEGRALAEWSL